MIYAATLSCKKTVYKIYSKIEKNGQAIKNSLPYFTVKLHETEQK